jgi:hypothetical protein
MVELVEREWWTAKLAAAESSDRTQKADRDAVIVEVDDYAVLALEVAGADIAVDPDGISDAQFGDCGRCSDGVEQSATRVDGVGDRDEVVVELAGCDLVEKQPFGRV